MMNFRTYTMLPQLPAAGLLERYMDSLGVVVPVGRTNLVLNPSVETNTTGYTAVGGSIARSTTEQYHGAYSLAVTPGAGTTDGAFYGTISLTSGTTYAVSCKVKGVAGVPYKLSVATTGGVDLVTKTFTGTGFWQWQWLFWNETSTTTRRIYVTKNNNTGTGVFYVDGLQVEACGSEGVFVTTYIDGDQRGFLANQFPPAYLWNGTPHASTSTRSGQTRAGGRVIPWKNLGFLLTAIIGLGMAAPRNEALNFAQLDGAEWENTIKPQRSVSFVGRWVDNSATGMQSGQGRLGRFIDRDRIGIKQPLALCLQAQECGDSIGEFVTIQRAVYASGMDGNAVELPTAAGNITFTQYLPYVIGRDGGAALSVQQSVSNANLILQRSAAGAWSAMGTGGTGTVVYSILQAANGDIYAGGFYTDMGGSGADNIARWDGSTWSVLASATALNDGVTCMALGPDGSIYIGGNFTNANGNANADFIAKWDGSSWSALGTGTNGRVEAIAVAPNGDVYVGGQFTDAGGSGAQRLAKWDGSTWSVVGAAAAINGTVFALAFDAAGNLYLGGNFTNANGVSGATRIAKWDGTSYTALSTGANVTVVSIVIGLDGTVYAGGLFTTIGGLSISYIAQWNGVQWSALGSGVNNSVNRLALSPDGTLYVAGNFTTAGGITPPNRAARWNGSAWVYFDVTPPGTQITTITTTPDNRLYFGLAATGSATAGALTTVTNNGTDDTSPTLIIRGPSSGTSRIYQLINVTTGMAIYFNLTISAGETVTLTLDPQNLSFVSSFRGNIYNTILPGSQPAQFVLQPGDNSIAFFAASSTVTATLQWETHYLQLEDALYQAAGDF